jgi:tRNA(Ser,Leu) C12 N-acetylase TAN1
MEALAMEDWNTVATSHRGRFEEGRKLLAEIGPVGATDYPDVLVMRCDDVDRALARLLELLPREGGPLAHVRPARATFGFRATEEFDELVRRVALAWAPRLLGKRFHVRMHRRGYQQWLSSRQEEQLVGDILLEALDREGEPGSLALDDPDAILAIDTVGGRAGVALWSRDELLRFPFLGLD